MLHTGLNLRGLCSTMVFISMPLWTLSWYFEMCFCLRMSFHCTFIRYGAAEGMVLASCVGKILRFMVIRTSFRLDHNSYLVGILKLTSLQI